VGNLAYKTLVNDELMITCANSLPVFEGSEFFNV